MICSSVTFFSCVHQPENYVFMHSHNTYELIYYQDGAGKTTIDGEIFSVEKGDIAIIPPHVVHDEKYLQKGTLMWCTFNCESDGFYQKARVIKAKQIKDFRILDILLLMKAENQKKQFNYQTMLNIQMSEILVLLARVDYVFSQKEFSSEVEYAKAFLKQNFNRKVDLRILAEQIGYSYDHFRHLFKNKTTISPNQYLINLRISKAKELLENTDDLVQNVASKCGFKDISRFIRIFKQETGFTPSKYQQIIHETEFGMYHEKSPDKHDEE